MIGNLLHDGGTSERRQYRRITLQFLVWLKTNKADAAIAGVGVDLSGGGIQFLVQDRIPLDEYSVGLQIKGRRMQANIITLDAIEVVFNEQVWQQHRARFIELLKADFDFIMAITEEHSGKPVATDAQAAQRKNSAGVLQSFGLYPSGLKERIVQILVAKKRLTPPKQSHLALLAAHYGGRQEEGNGEVPLHRLSIQSQVGEYVFVTHFLVSEDGAKVIVRD